MGETALRILAHMILRVADPLCWSVSKRALFRFSVACVRAASSFSLTDPQCKAMAAIVLGFISDGVL